MVEIFVLVVVLELVDVIGILVYIMWVFIVWSVELIVNVKSRGLFIIVSMIWMYLLLDSLVIEGKFFLDNYFFFYDLNLCLEFFLGSQSDCLILFEGIRDGVLDVIVIDYVFYIYEEKIVVFFEVFIGVIGL